MTSKAKVVDAPARKPAPKPAPAGKAPTAKGSVQEIAAQAVAAGIVRGPMNRFKNVKLPDGTYLEVAAPVAFIDVESLDVLASSALSNLAVVTLNARNYDALAIISDKLSHSAGLNLRDSQDVNAAISREYNNLESDCASSPKGSDADMFQVVRCRLHLAEQLSRMQSTVYNDTQAFWQRQAQAAFLATANQPEKSVALAMTEVLRACHRALNCGIEASLYEAYGRTGMESLPADLDYEIRNAVASNFTLFARGPQFDVAALERLMFMSLGIRPAKSPLESFQRVPSYREESDLHDPIKTCITGRYAASWYYRAAKDVRTFIEGFGCGLCATLDTQSDVDAVMRDLYARARANSTDIVNRAVQAVSVDSLSADSHNALFGNRNKVGAHIAELDVSYDIALVLPILTGSVAHRISSIMADKD